MRRLIACAAPLLKSTIMVFHVLQEMIHHDVEAQAAADQTSYSHLQLCIGPCHDGMIKT